MINRVKELKLIKTLSHLSPAKSLIVKRLILLDMIKFVVVSMVMDPIKTGEGDGAWIPASQINHYNPLSIRHYGCVSTSSRHSL